MKQIIFILCVLIACLTAAHAGEMYNCIDRDGNGIITDKPQDGMKKCVLTDSDDISSTTKSIASQKETHKDNYGETNSSCGLVASNMNKARIYLNQAAARSTSELDEGKVDVKKAADFLLEAQRKSSDCQCSSLGDEIYRAAQSALFAVNENSVERFSNLLTEAIRSFNKAQEAYKLCR